ncbi:MAG: ribose 5-phosphate isomerase B [Clostridiales bacterium]|nr:ribose 5-phosphate isomerase B [Clostridiales bacterium]
MRISLASDHGGLELKKQIADYLKELGHTAVDYGTYSKERCDYPDFARPAALAVANGECERAILVCTTGIGVSMVANKVKGVRCALCVNPDMAKMTRAHNNANIIALGQKYVDIDTAKQIVDNFLNTPFEGGVHATRVDKIDKD